MSSKQGEISSVPISQMQEHSGRQVKEDGRVINKADAYDFSGSIKSILTDATGRQAIIDIFGKLVTARQVTQISEHFSQGGPSTGVVEGGTGSGLMTIEESMLRLKTGADDGTYFAESLESLRYLPGFGGYGFFTFQGINVGDLVNVFVGLFTAEDGFFLGINQGRPCVAIRRYTGGVANTEYIYQEDWNLDKLDGTGNSQMIADFSKGQVYHICYGYLGFAPIFFSIMNESGKLIPFHVIKYPNLNDLTNISLPYLPIRIEVNNTGSGKAIDVGIGSLDLGIYDGGGVTYPTNRLQGITGSRTLATPKSITGPDYILAIRSKMVYSGRTNRINSVISALSWATQDSVKSVSIQLIKDPDIITDGTWTDVRTDESPLEYTIDTVFDVDSGRETGIGAALTRDRDFYADHLDESYNLALRRGEIVMLRVNSTNGIVSNLFLSIKDLF